MTIGNSPDNSVLQFNPPGNVGVKITSGGPDGKESACNKGDLDLIPGLGRSPEEGQGSPLQHPCLENSMDRGA